VWPRDSDGGHERRVNGGKICELYGQLITVDKDRFYSSDHFILGLFSDIISYVQSFTYRGQDHAEMPIVFYADVTCSGTAISLLHLQQLLWELVAQAKSAALGHGRPDSVGNIGR
jgi:hypothetical protein